jgi:hypothetical protein
MVACGLAMLVLARASGAAVKEIEASATYHLGDNDSKLDGHRLALLEAKRTALEKAGTYVESTTEVKDLQVTKDEIRTYSAGILRVEETKDPQWQMVGRNLEVTVFVKVEVDQDDVAKKIAGLQKDKEATQQLKAERAKVEENERKVKELNRQLKKAKKGAPSTERAQAQRNEALEGIDSSTLKAQAAVAEKFSVQAYSSARAYMERQMPAIKGCYHSAFSSEKQAAAGVDTGVAILAMPPLALLICKARRAGADRTEKEDT